MVYSIFTMMIAKIAHTERFVAVPKSRYFLLDGELQKEKHYL
jgi:hypothetical protein